ncbi:hypothetical protein AN639_04680 [Candidatus Epulonipiscium fishelsonii]|uniref:Uncharacterized protein n=1 Tax=Candidatus Epulonipiscium fishelsonii TaxID=77094 RepID=A0ACC8XD38_9FIRM|nr:hypothetical protein AN639_04680 [Epulopiscium sp. SCG-B05WGA-EpuloA1]ONI40775.1 hypothetical protein AN396_04985 [Epulopiscium sp. SCG-B11WGA-EpuloA1]ONI47083.1 hypothetical protein AN644_01665 [Epulopiscium sp. SCG-C06WGA-EpuloA1]
MTITGLAQSQAIMQQQQQQMEATGFENILKGAMETKDDAELMEACQKVESYFLSTIFKQMKSSIQSDNPLIEKGEYEETFEDMLTDTQVDGMISAGGVGLAEMMYKQLSRETVSKIDTSL